MSDSSLNRLPRNILANRVQEAKHAQAALKAPQLTGASSARGYLSQNSSEFDWSGRLNKQSPGHMDMGVAILLVKFESPIEWPLLDPIIEIYKSSNGASWSRLRYNEPPLDSPYYGYTVYELPPTVDETNSVSFHVFISALFNSWAAVKALAVSNDELSVTVTRIQ